MLATVKQTSAVKIER